MRRFGWGDVALLVAFVGVHLLLAVLALTLPNQPIGDVTIAYRNWVEQGRTTGQWVGIDSTWVYPVVALLPMQLAALGGLDDIASGWLLLMTLLDAVALVALWPHRVVVRGRRIRVAWWWLAFLLCLGPIGLGRIDTVATAIALVGVAMVAARPAVASALFTLAAWVKVWPAALVGVLLLLRRGRRTGVVVGAVVVTAVVVLVDLLFGGGRYLLSFVGQQTGRALQIESPLATPFMWLAGARVPGYGVGYDRTINTFEISGGGTHAAAAVSTPLMALVVLAALALAVRAVVDGVRRSEVAPLLAMILVGVLIVTNKVGSPQYVGWYAVPVVWGLVAGAPSARRFAPMAMLALVVAFLTQLVYPDFYDRVLLVRPDLLVVLTLRNALEVVLLVVPIVVLTRAGSAARRSGAVLERR